MRLLWVCIGFLAAIVLAAAEARSASQACQRDNLWAEQVLLAEAALVLSQAEPEVDVRCVPEAAGDGASIECQDGRTMTPIGAPPPSLARCDIRFGGVPRLHLHPSPPARKVQTALVSPPRLQAYGDPISLDRGDPVAASATMAPPYSPVPREHIVAGACALIAPGHRNRLFRPPRPAAALA